MSGPSWLDNSLDSNSSEFVLDPKLSTHNSRHHSPTTHSSHKQHHHHIHRHHDYGGRGGDTSGKMDQLYNIHNASHPFLVQLNNNDSTSATSSYWPFEDEGSGLGNELHDWGNLSNGVGANESTATGTVEVSWDLAFRDSSRFWVQYVLVPLVVIIGVMGNAVTIYILTRRPMRSSTNV